MAGPRNAFLGGSRWPEWIPIGRIQYYPLGYLIFRKHLLDIEMERSHGRVELIGQSRSFPAPGNPSHQRKFTRLVRRHRRCRDKFARSKFSQSKNISPGASIMPAAVAGRGSSSILPIVGTTRETAPGSAPSSQGRAYFRNPEKIPPQPSPCSLSSWPNRNYPEPGRFLARSHQAPGMRLFASKNSDGRRLVNSRAALGGSRVGAGIAGDRGRASH
jgi:hypothetical protein